MTTLQQFLPIFIVRGMLIPFTAAVVSTGTVFWLFSLRLRRLPPTAHWSETARLYWHLRLGRAMATPWIVMTACVATFESSSTRSVGSMLIPVVLSTIGGCMLGFREAGRGLPLPEILRSGGLKATIARFVLFPALPTMLVIMAFTWRRGLCVESFVFTGVIVLALIALCVGGSVAILRITGLLRPVDEPLQSFSRALAVAQGVPLRHVMRMDLPMANAFAFMWTKDLGFTNATLTTLDQKELSSVICHELGHLKEGLLTRWTRLIGLPAIAIVSLAPAAIHDGQPLIALGFFGAFILLTRFAARFHKRLEISADENAHLSETEEGVYARALEKIHAASLIPAVLHPRSHYPSLYDRMTSSGITPDFPRPEAPGRLVPILSGLVATALFFCLWQTLSHVAPDPNPVPATSETRD